MICLSLVSNQWTKYTFVLPVEQILKISPLKKNLYFWSLRDFLKYIKKSDYSLESLYDVIQAALENSPCKKHHVCESQVNQPNLVRETVHQNSTQMGVLVSTLIAMWRN